MRRLAGWLSSFSSKKSHLDSVSAWKSSWTAEESCGALHQVPSLDPWSRDWGVQNSIPAGPCRYSHYPGWLFASCCLQQHTCPPSPGWHRRKRVSTLPTSHPRAQWMSPGQKWEPGVNTLLLPPGLPRQTTQILMENQPPTLEKIQRGGKAGLGTRARGWWACSKGLCNIKSWPDPAALGKVS